MPTPAARKVTPFPAGRRKPRAGLVLAGGGARAAYQAGVLKAVRDILGGPQRNPFPVVCGTSLGALNAALLAAFADNFTRAAANLLELWEHMRAERIYRTDSWSIGKAAAAWLGALTLGPRRWPRALLDSAPLRELVRSAVPFERIQGHIDSGALYGLCVSASGYTSGESIAFFQGGSGTEAWEPGQLVGAAVGMAAEHVLAAAALPPFFPAVKLHREYFGDGSLRARGAVSLALHLAADRVLVVGGGCPAPRAARSRASGYPSLAQIAGQALDGIFVDNLLAELERLELGNRLANHVPVDRLEEAGVGLRPVRLLLIAPSEPVERIAARFVHELPRTVRFLLRPTGALSRSGAGFASYVLFGESFCRALVDLGYRDAAEREAEIKEFFQPTREEAQ
jgi:NTE family protein